MCRLSTYDDGWSKSKNVCVRERERGKPLSPSVSIPKPSLKGNQIG